MPEDINKDKKEKTLSLKTNTKSSKSTIGTRSRGSSRVSTVVVESKRGKISKTRKPSAPNIKTRTSSVTSRTIKEPTESDVFGNLTDKEKIAREKALLDADTRKKNEAVFEKGISKEGNIKKETKKVNPLPILLGSHGLLEGGFMLTMQSRRDMTLHFYNGDVGRSTTYATTDVSIS